MFNWTFKYHINVTTRIEWGVFIGSACVRSPCAVHTPAIRRRIELITARTGMYPMHTPFAPWIRNNQVLIRNTIRSGIAIHAPYSPHVHHPFAIDTQLKCNTCEIVAPEMFHQTISAILLGICSFFCTLYEHNGIAGQWNRGIKGIWKPPQTT